MKIHSFCKLLVIGFSLFFTLAAQIVEGRGSVSVDEYFVPVDNSGPRETLETFLAALDYKAAVLLDYHENPSRAKTREVSAAARRCIRFLDLRQIRPALEEEVGAETVLFLWETLSRVKLPQFSDIPSSQDIEANDLTGNTWRIPGTELSITRIDTGAYEGKYLFSADTVERAGVAYRRVKDLPYVRPMLIEEPRFELLNATGWMISPRLLELLPDWAKTPVFELPLWKWGAFFSLIGIAVGLLYGLVRVVYRGERRLGFVGFLIYLSVPGLVLFLTSALRYLFRSQIIVRGETSSIPTLLTEAGGYFAAAWIAWLCANSGFEALLQLPRFKRLGMNEHLLRLSSKVFGFFTAIALILHAAHRVGFPVSGLVAGVSVGGVALALAGKKSLENFIGSVSLYTDKPVSVGDFCRYGEDPHSGWLRIGEVESIGIRSTKIRGIDRTVTTIPNAEFSEMHIVNLSKRDAMLFKHTFNFGLESTEGQLRHVVMKCRELLLRHPMTLEEPPLRVRLLGLGEYAFRVELQALVDTDSYYDFLSIQEDLMFHIVQIVNEVGVRFAVPTRKNLIGRTTAVDATKREQAEDFMERLASLQQLPFPDFSEEKKQDLWNTMDYPASTSPYFKPKEKEQKEPEY